MSWQNLFKQSKPHSSLSSPRLDGVVHALAKYIDRVTKDNPRAEVRPAMAAKALNEPELAVLAAFYVLERAGAVSPRYGLYCRAHQSCIETYASMADIPDETDCPICDGVHTPDDGSAEIELFFIVMDINRLRSFASTAA
jgi:hypothetical protein